jgi:CheY-like chemotaxis protein
LDFPVNIARNVDREVVLVVDDEPTVRRFARRVLAEQGYEVHEAADGAEALDMVRATFDRLDVVVSDIVMPKLNGVELLHRLAIVRPQLPVILMSGYAGPQLTERGIEAPCSILAKPFSAESLVAEVRRCIRGQPT